MDDTSTSMDDTDAILHRLAKHHDLFAIERRVSDQLIGVVRFAEEMEHDVQKFSEDLRKSSKDLRKSYKDLEQRIDRLEKKSRKSRLLFL